MKNHFSKIKEYLIELDYQLVLEDEDQEMLMIENEDSGISNLILDCEDPILIIELHLFDIKKPSNDTLIKFMQLNREIIHGALALDESKEKVIFRDTLQLENIDLNELQGTLNSIQLFLSENAELLIQLSKEN